MSTFPQTATYQLGHAQVYPARPIPSLHAIHRSLRKRTAGRTGLTQSLHTIACDEDEFFAVCEFLAERRIGGAAKTARKRKAVSRNKTKQN